MAAEFRDFWELVRLPNHRVTDFGFVDGPQGGPVVMVQLDPVFGLGFRYLAVARLGDWPDVNLVWRLARERLAGAIDLVWVPEYPEQRGLRFWYARGKARVDEKAHETGCISSISERPNK